MNWLNKLERKYRKYAIPNLMYYIIILYLIGFVLDFVAPNLYSQFLSLDVNAVLHGQIWRLVTFIIQPPSDSLLFVAIELYLYYMIGRSLENAWGAFRFNLYYFSGMLFNILAVFLFYGVTYLIYGYGISFPIGMAYINRSMFLAFAALYPNVEMLLMFIIPIKIKYLGWLYGILMAWEVLQALMLGTPAGFAYGIMVLVSVANFLIFFFSTRNYKRISPKEIKRKQAYKRKVREAEYGTVTPFPSKGTITRHKCAVCGRTELDDDTLEFRFCSKCDGNYEYCMEHLYTHEHVKK